MRKFSEWGFCDVCRGWLSYNFFGFFCPNCPDHEITIDTVSKYVKVKE